MGYDGGEFFAGPPPSIIRQPKRKSPDLDESTLSAGGHRYLSVILCPPIESLGRFANALTDQYRER